MGMGEVKLFIASPSYPSSYCGEYVSSLVDTIKDLQNHNIKTVYKQVNGMHWVDVARDIIAHLFIHHTDCTHLLQIDTDLGWGSDAPRRMLSRDKDIIGGVYPIKTDVATLYPVNDKEEVLGLPGGFLMVKREVIENMSRHLPKYKCASLGYGELNVAPLFTRQMRDDGYTGEDFAFCNRAIEAGYKLNIEHDIDFTHVGIKQWHGNYKGK